MSKSNNVFNPFLEKITEKKLGQKPPTLDELDPVVCSKCGNSIFDRYFKIFRLSALKTASGKAQIFNVPVYVCGSCAEILDTNSNVDSAEKSKSKKEEKTLDKE